MFNSDLEGYLAEVYKEYEQRVHSDSFAISCEGISREDRNELDALVLVKIIKSSHKSFNELMKEVLKDKKLNQIASKYQHIM